MGAKEGVWWEVVEESSSISHLLIHSSAQQCYFEMKTNMELYFSLLSSIILWTAPTVRWEEFRTLSCMGPAENFSPLQPLLFYIKLSLEWTSSATMKSSKIPTMIHCN